MNYVRAFHRSLLVYFQVLKQFLRLTKQGIEGLRYRAEDVARSITRNVIKEARAKELKLELLNSERLKVRQQGRHCHIKDENDPIHVAQKNICNIDS